MTSFSKVLIFLRDSCAFFLYPHYKKWFGLGFFREVNVYRLLCKDTIEKAILNCANDKIRLHEDISGTVHSTHVNSIGFKDNFCTT